MDARWKKLGELLVSWSAGVKPGERVMISMGEIDTFPLVRGVYEAVVRAGGFPQVQLLSETLRHQLLKYGTPEQLSWVGLAYQDFCRIYRALYDQNAPLMHELARLGR